MMAKKITRVVILSHGDYEDRVKQVEFLLGKPLAKKVAADIGRLCHLTRGNEWVLKVLRAAGKTVNDIRFEKDRVVLREEFRLSTEYKDLL